MNEAILITCSRCFYCVQTGKFIHLSTYLTWIPFGEKKRLGCCCCWKWRRSLWFLRSRFSKPQAELTVPEPWIILSLWQHLLHNSTGFKWLILQVFFPATAKKQIMHLFEFEFVWLLFRCKWILYKSVKSIREVRKRVQIWNRAKITYNEAFSMLSCWYKLFLFFIPFNFSLENLLLDQIGQNPFC